MNLKYTLCFVRHRSSDSVLMLYRYNHPNRHLWNGVGGKLESEETPRECVIREVEEETGILLNDVRFGGIVTWESAPETETEGMYVYVADIDCIPFNDKKTDEGWLSWFRVHNAMVASEDVVENIAYFLPPMLRGEEPKRWHCTYDGWKLQRVDMMPCPELEGV